METVRLAALAMGTRFEAVLVGEDAGFLRAAGEEALELISDEHVRLSRFEPDSVVSHVNRNASSDWVGVDGEFAELLKLCAQAVTASGGAFDPTVTSSSDCGWAGVELDGRRIRFHEPGLSLDFGAIAKGWALDLARVALLDAGVERALMHGGTSSVLAIGAPPERAGWGVALGEKGAPQCSRRDSALGVSAPNALIFFLRPKSIFSGFFGPIGPPPLVIEGGPDRVGEKNQQIGLITLYNVGCNGNTRKHSQYVIILFNPLVFITRSKFSFFKLFINIFLL